MKVSEESEKLYREYNIYNSQVSRLQWEISKRENRGWKPKPELNKELDEITKKRDEANKIYIAYQKKNPEATYFSVKPGESEIVDKQSKLISERKAILEATKIRNLAENPYTRAWMSLGDRFLGVINYRSYNG